MIIGSNPVGFNLPKELHFFANSSVRLLGHTEGTDAGFDHGAGFSSKQFYCHSVKLQKIQLFFSLRSNW